MNSPSFSGSRCPCGTYCQNRRFQQVKNVLLCSMFIESCDLWFLSQANYQPVEVFKTSKKGWGLRAAADIPQ